MKTKNKIFIGAGAGIAALTVASLMAAAVPNVFEPDKQPVGYVGQPVISNSNVAAGASKIYSIDYDARNWSGNLHSYPVTSDGAVSTTDDWAGGASAMIKTQSANNARYIVTKKAGGVGIPFQWQELTSGANSQQAALDAATAATPTATTSPVLNYIRGVTTNEGSAANKYRMRGYGMGDVIHSTPVYWTDGTNRTVFVGANDGMLHAIDAATGKERFAYIPSVLIPKLATLASQTYSHQYFVDGRMDVKKFGTKTILTGTLGGGGKSLYALDVTNAVATAEDDAAKKVMWEITPGSTGFAELGDTYAAPTLFSLSVPPALPGAEETFVPALVVGNGYNNGGNGHAVLYLIKAETGELINAFDTGSGTTDSPNGLSSPSLWDTDGDGKKDTAYAGDINGNLWKFSLVKPYTVSSVKSLFSNPTPGDAHAITMAPGLSRHPLGGTMVTFVTGRMLFKEDATDTATHYAYGIWDGAPAENTALLEQTLTEQSYTGVVPNLRVRTATAKTPNWTKGAANHRGWVTALPTAGERLVGDGAFVTGAVFQFMTTNPAIRQTALPPGENWWMQLNVLTGGDTGSTNFDLDNDRDFTSLDQVGGQDPVGRYMGGGVRSQLIAISADGVDVFQSNYDKNGAPPPGPTTTVDTKVTGDRGVSGGHFDFDIYCYTNCGDGKGASKSDGAYYLGTNTETNTKNLDWTHVHEYDDIYDVTGVNMLAPSQALFNLSRVVRSGTSVSTTVAGASTSTTKTAIGIVASSVPGATVGNPNIGSSTAVPGFPTTVVNALDTIITTKTKYTTTTVSTATANAVEITGGRKKGSWTYDKITTTTTYDTVVTVTNTTPLNLRFKVLIANQAYSPAVTLTLADKASTYDAKAFAYQSDGLPLATLASKLKEFHLGSDADAITGLQVNMPLDAFKSKDWGTGISRAGLHPTKADCVYNKPTLGPNGEWRNGALTVQIVDPTVAETDLQFNVDGHPELGYRLKSGSMKTKLIAEYTLFWHHPNDKCMGNIGWVMNPPQDTSASDATAGKKAAGSSDPGAGQLFNGDPNANGDTTEYKVGTVVLPVVTNADSSKTTTTIVTTANANGGFTITTTVVTVPDSTQLTDVGIVTGGAVGTTGKIDTGGIDKNAANLGRITWRELQK
jgi:type IV pilus assembly protein PilY1